MPPNWHYCLFRCTVTNHQPNRDIQITRNKFPDRAYYIARSLDIKSIQWPDRPDLSSGAMGGWGSWQLVQLRATMLKPIDICYFKCMYATYRSVTRPIWPRSTSGKIESSGLGPEEISVLGESIRRIRFCVCGARFCSEWVGRRMCNTNRGFRSL